MKKTNEASQHFAGDHTAADVVWPGQHIIQYCTSVDYSTVLYFAFGVGIGSFQNGNFPFWKLSGNFPKLSKPKFGGLETSSGQRKFPDFSLVYCVTAHHQVYQYTALLVTRDSCSCDTY